MATAGSHTKSQLDGLYKDVYDGKLDSLLPDFTILQKKIKFNSAKKTGRDYVRSVKLTNEQGFTYGQGIQTLSSIISADVDDAKVRGNSLTLRTGFSYDSAANMSSSEAAFISATEFKFMAMMEAASYRLEHQMLYGGDGLGIVASADDGADTVTIDDASWAPGTWSGQEGAVVDIYDAGGSLRVGDLTISEIDHDTKTLSFSGSPNLSTVVATDVLFFDGAKDNEMIGLRSIVSNQGTLFGIDGTQYSLWKGNVSDVGSANLTLKKIYDGVAKAVSKGLMDDLVVLVSPATYAVLANDQASLRRYDASYGSKKGKNGFQSIEFYGQNGLIEIVSHAMVREEEAIAFPVKHASRIGATDLTFKTPGRGDEMFQQLADQTGYECRLYSEQAIFHNAPAKCILFENISNA